MSSLPRCVLGILFDKPLGQVCGNGKIKQIPHYVIYRGVGCLGISNVMKMSKETVRPKVSSKLNEVVHSPLNYGGGG